MAKKPRLIMMLSENWTMTDRRDYPRIVSQAVEVERAGFTAVMVGEHVVMGPNSCVKGLPENPRDWLAAGNQPNDYPHPSNLPMLSAMAAVTTDLKLLAAGSLTALRHPLALAKDFGTVDMISRGRLIVLPAVSWQEEEYAALGVPFNRRGAILDEQLEILTKLWRDGSPVKHDGRFFSFGDAYLEPSTYDGPITLWIGGREVIDVTKRRLVQYGQGLFTLKAATADQLAEIRADLRAAGRNPGDLTFAALATDSFKGRDDRLSLSQVTAKAEGLREAGYDTFVIKPSQFIDDADLLADFAHDCMKAFAKLA